MDIQPSWNMSDALSPAQQLVLYFGVVVGIMINVFLWTTATGVNQSTEIRAGLAGLIAIFAWIVLVWIVSSVVFWPGHTVSEFRFYLVGSLVLMSPFGTAFLLAESPEVQAVVWSCTGICLQVTVAAVLIGVWLVRYVRFSVGPRRVAASGALPAGGQRAGLRPPCRSPLRALAWKQWRECLPICAAGLVLILGWTALLVLSQAGHIDRRGSGHFLLATTRTLVKLTTGLGPVIALVVGVGAFVAEMQPKLLGFWRSRPVSPSQWFWTKYLTGATVVLVFLLGPMVLVGTCAWLTGADITPPRHLLHSAVWSWVLLFAFTTAVCLTCVVRQPVYAGILSLGCLLGVALAPEVFESLSWLRWHKLRTFGECVTFSLCLGALTAGVLLFAWQSLVRNWGWKL
jgi:hypothetical protein